MQKRSGFKRLALGAMTLALGILSSHGFAAEEAPYVAIVPRPLLLEYSGGEFTLTAETEIRFQDQSEDAAKIAKTLAGVLDGSTGFTLKMKEESAESKDGNSIQFLLSGDAALGEEGYTVRVENGSIIARAANSTGLFYSMETICQLFPPAIESKSTVTGTPWTVPGLVIIDKPRFRWRGTLLDCSRHFMDKAFIFTILDDMAYHKLNRFHWHLTDDQGWRLEIKKYPKLTEVGAWRGEGDKRYGGFYTQEDVKEIVAYAADRHIDVIPEIEMPGHSSAAIASYPELSCTDGPKTVTTEWGVMKDILCAGKEEPFKFMDGVMAEVATLFPSEYVHIGGDEAPKDAWKACPLCQKRMKDEGIPSEEALQTYFMQRVQKSLAAHGKKVIGWDEIYEGGLPPGAIVQYWKHEANFLGAIKEGHPVIASPHWFTYFDYPEVLSKDNGKPDWMPALPLKKIYSFEPLIKGVEPYQEHLVWGSECAMWSEHAPMDQVQFQLFPRLSAFSEVLWSPRSARDFTDFQKRMEFQYPRMDALGIHYNPLERDAAKAAAAEPEAPTPAKS
ncbi:hypothetical protein BH09SUM1_BH09SUM1_03490 [soil metagenome]